MSAAAADQTEQARPRMTEPLRVREFRLLLTGFVLGQSVMPLQFVASIAWVQSFAAEEVQYILVGAIGTIRGLGMLGFGLFGGALADRFDRRRLLMVTQALAFATNIGIAALMWLGATDLIGLAVFFLLTLIASAAFALDGPTRQAIAPEILGPRLTPAGIALQQAGMQFGLPLSILVSGVMIDQLGTGNVFAISAGGHLAEIIVLAMMSYRTVFSAAHMRGVEHGPRQALRDIAAGLRFSRSKPVILWTILIVVLMMALIMPPTGTLGPVWVTTVVGASWSQFSYIAFFWGFGALTASGLMVGFSWIERKGLLTGLGVATMALGFIVFTFGTTQLNAMAGNFLLGVGMTVANVAGIAILAHETPNDFRGRVMSLYFQGMGLAQALGLPIGALAQVVSMETLFPLMAIGTFAFLILVMAVRPVILRARVSAAVQLPAAAPPPAAAAPNGLVVSYIARVAPNKPGPA